MVLFSGLKITKASVFYECFRDHAGCRFHAGSGAVVSRPLRERVIEHGFENDRGSFQIGGENGRVDARRAIREHVTGREPMKEAPRSRTMVRILVRRCG